VRHDPFARKVMSWVFNKMAGWYLDSRFHDLNVGIRMFDRHFVAAAEIKQSLNLANPELYVRARLAGLTVAEVEASHFPRDKGQSCHSVLRLYQTFAKVRRYFRELSVELNATAASECTHLAPRDDRSHLAERDEYIQTGVMRCR